MIIYQRDKRGYLFANVENKDTKDRFIIGNAFNPQIGLWQQMVIPHRGLIACYFWVLKGLVSGGRGNRPLLICDCKDSIEAEENVKIIAELYEKYSHSIIAKKYGTSSVNQFGQSMLFFEKHLWQKVFDTENKLREKHEQQKEDNRIKQERAHEQDDCNLFGESD